MYWTTSKENTQKAYDDGLSKNDKGWEDSQSMPVSQYNVFTNKHLADYGSAQEAARITGINIRTILRQCRYKRPKKITTQYFRTPTYFRFFGDESTITTPIITAYDFQTDEIVGQYLNLKDAERQTRVSAKTIQYMIQQNRKPKWIKNGKIYFLQRNRE